MPIIAAHSKIRLFVLIETADEKVILEIHKQKTMLKRTNTIPIFFPFSLSGIALLIHTI